MSILANLQAIKLLKSKSKFTDEDKTVLEQFNGWGAFWQIFKPQHPQHSELRHLLSEEEFQIANSTILSAYYTNPEVVQCVHKILAALGVPQCPVKQSQLRVLEPSCGIGYFLKGTNFNWTAVELDPITAQITQILYPNATVHNIGFEKFVSPHNIFDLVIGNIPFNNYSVFEEGYEGLKIHNHFLLKSIHLAKPNGLIALITSTGTLDSPTNQTFREQVAKIAKLITAFRLPSGTMSNANTEVTCDLLVFQKTTKTQNQSWTKLKSLSVEGSKCFINYYYYENGRNLIGNLCIDKLYGSQGRTALTPYRNISTIDVLMEETKRLEQCYIPNPTPNNNLNPLLQQLPNNEFTIINDKIYYRSRWNITEHDTITNNPKLALLIKLSTLAEQLVKTQSDNTRQELNTTYDQYRQQYGILKGTTNIFQPDRRYELLLSLEKNGNKAEILHSNTCRQYTPPIKCANAKDALIHCLKSKGKLDLNWIANHC